MTASCSYNAPERPDMRTPIQDLMDLAGVLGESSVLRFSDSLPYCVFVLDENRQVVHANRTALELGGYNGLEEVIGLRPGEFLGCTHAHELPTGCGTTEFCSQCGALQTILGSRNGGTSGVCRMLRECEGRTQAMTLHAACTPFSFEGHSLSIFSARDISKDVRRRTLERLFFHDVLNLAGGLGGMMELFANNLPGENRDTAETLRNGFEVLVDEINAHRTLAAAENNELQPKLRKMLSGELLDTVAETYSRHLVARRKTIHVARDSQDLLLFTDRALVSRALGNLVKNALEACMARDTVILRCVEQDGMAVFSVHNPGHMEREVQLQIFNRSFSTKGESRGLGTYSVLLLVEGFLKGKVWFESDQECGTTFYMALPLSND